MSADKIKLTPDLLAIHNKLAEALAAPSVLKAGDLTPAYERIHALQTQPTPKKGYAALLESNPT